MANEFEHVSVGAELTRSEYESITGHHLDSQAVGDMVVAADADQLERLAVAPGLLQGATGAQPAWTTSPSVTGTLTVNNLTVTGTSVGVSTAQGSDETPLVASALGDSGDGDNYSREDHIHPAGAGIPGDATPLADGVADAGDDVPYARQDHIHPTLAGAASPVDVGITAVGTATSFSREDHVHGPAQDIAISDSAPTNSQGANGELWFEY